MNGRVFFIWYTGTEISFVKFMKGNEPLVAAGKNYVLRPEFR